MADRDRDAEVSRRVVADRQDATLGPRIQPQQQLPERDCRPAVARPPQHGAHP
jgi:hypothetical protein